MSQSALTLHNGQDKRTIYVAFKGKVYDVSTSRFWLRGLHYEHWAGQDLTDELIDAPHGSEVFDDLVPIAVLRSRSGRGD